MARFRFTLSIGFANGRHDEQVEIPDEELEGLDEKARTEVIEGWYCDWRSNYLDGGWSESEE